MVETTDGTGGGDGLSDDVERASVGSWCGGLETHFDEVKGMAGDYGADTADTAGDEGPQGFHGCGFSGGGSDRDFADGRFGGGHSDGCEVEGLWVRGS